MKASYTAIPIANCESRFLVHLRVNVIESLVAAFAHVRLQPHCPEALPVVGIAALGCSSSVDRVALPAASKPRKCILRQDTRVHVRYQSQQNKIWRHAHVICKLHIIDSTSTFFGCYESRSISICGSRPSTEHVNGLIPSAKLRD